MQLWKCTCNANTIFFPDRFFFLSFFFSKREAFRTAKKPVPGGQGVTTYPIYWLSEHSSLHY